MLRLGAEIPGSTSTPKKLSYVKGALLTLAIVLGCSSNSLAQTQRTIWSGTSVPATPDVGPDSPVELGVSFKADTNGSITGIRFYKSAGNTGTHVGNLWTSGGALMASAAFTGETASGWQQVNFAQPVAITANTVYVASYHATAGHYSVNWSYFATAGVNNAPLHALATTSGTPDGRFAYGGGSAFPTATHQAANYWVDVAFVSNGATTLQVTTAQLAGGAVAGSYNATLSASGGSTPYTWSLASGTLPNGLTLNAAGSISGTPSLAGSFSFTVQVKDAAAQSASRNFSINVVSPVPTVAITSPASGATGSPLPVTVNNGTTASDCTLFASPSGNDANSGSSSSSPKTFTGAAAVTQPGSVVCLLGGTYNLSSTFYPPTSGSPSSWIVYKNYGNSPVNLAWTASSAWALTTCAS